MNKSQKFRLKVTSNGRITIPLEVRERLGMLRGTDVDFVLSGKSVLMIKRQTDDQKKKV